MTGLSVGLHRADGGSSSRRLSHVAPRRAADSEAQRSKAEGDACDHGACACDTDSGA